jgi:GR25 family glycosyltransferase involved in LPS biosynthesis
MLPRTQDMIDKRPSTKKLLMILCVVLYLLYFFYIHLTDTPDITGNWDTPTMHTPTQGFVITMNNETVWKVAEQLKVAFEIQDMHVVMGHVGNYSTLSLYNRHLMRNGRTDTLQIGNLNMLGCLESHREVWTRVQQDSYIFEDDAVPAKNAMYTVKTLLMDNADRHWSVIHLEVPSGFVSRHLFTPDIYQYTNIGQITQTCRDCTVYSNRGYIITKEAAQIMTQNYEPPVVQADAYMSLLNAYHPKFKQVWTRVSAVDWRPHMSSVQESFEPISIVHGILNLVNL